MRAATMPGAGGVHEPPPAKARALGWLARLLLLTEAQLGALLGLDQDEHQVRGLLGALGRERLIGSLIVDSPEFAEALRLYHLTDAGVQAVAWHMGIAVADLAGRLPVSRDELLAHLARVETAVGIADTVAWLADALRRSRGEGTGVAVELADAGSTPWAPQHGRPSVTPPEVEAWVRFRAGGLCAAALLAWDRAGVPRAHRRARVAAWYRADEAPDTPWGRGLPPLLVLCPDARAVAEWDDLLDRSAARRGRGLLRAACCTLPELTARGPLAPVWRLPGGRRLALLDLLHWADSAVGSRSIAAGSALVAPFPQRWPASGAGGGAARPLEEARRLVTGTGQCSPAARRAALVTGLSATQKTLLGWVARHPLLPAGYLAALLELPERGVTALLDELVRRGLIAIDATPGFVDGAGPCYVLMWAGADFLAACDGVPLYRYLREGTLAAARTPLGGRGREQAAVLPSDVRLVDLRRHPAHTAGVQGFALALAREAAAWRRRGADHRLLVWQNAAEAEERFAVNGRPHAIRPDARFRYRLDGAVYDLLLEWDRGLVRRRDYARKFGAYAGYFAAAPPPAEATCRVVVVTPAAAVVRVRAAVTDAAQSCPVLLEVIRIVTAEAVAGGRMLAALLEPAGVGSGT